MFVSESSAAATLDAAHMPAFAAAYADVPTVSYSALREIVLMMRPKFCFRMCGIAARMAFTIAKRCTATCCSKSPGSLFSKRLLNPRPALLKSISMRPVCLTVVAIIRSTSSALLTSKVIRRAAGTSPSPSPLISAAITVAPSALKP